MPLLNENTVDYICYICRQSHENLRTLHKHHVSVHTKEQLSFAVIALNGWTYSGNDTNLFEGSENSVTRGRISKENNSTGAVPVESSKQPEGCLPRISLAATTLTNAAPENIVPYYNENSFKLSEVPLDMSILHNSGAVNNRSVNSVENAQSLYGLNNLNITVAQQEKQNAAKNDINAQCDYSVSAISSDDFSGSETETDIEVNGNGRLFDSDYEIKIDIFDEYDDLEIEEGSRPSSNKNKDNINNQTVGRKSNVECSYGTVSAIISQKKAVKEECANTSTASVKEALGTLDNEMMSCTCDKNCPLGCSGTHSCKSNQLVSTDISKVNDKYSEIAATKHSIVESSKTLGCSCDFNDQVNTDCHSRNCSLHEVFVPLVGIGNAEYRQDNHLTVITDLSTEGELSFLHRRSSPLADTSEKEELSENSEFYCAAKSVYKPVHKLKVERLDHNDLTFCTSSEIISNQIMKKDTVPIYRCAITCVARSGGFFKAKVDPGLLKDATVSKVAERRFFCESCGKGYKKKSHLERHLRAHTGERPFQCSYCTKRFAVRSILKQHVRIHTGEKPYCCSVCLQRFPQKSGLMTHMMLHTGKPFKCDLCEKSFVSNHKLLQHLKSHETQSIYSCSECKTKFFTEGALREHGKIHSKAKLQCLGWQVDFLQNDF